MNRRYNKEKLKRIMLSAGVAAVLMAGGCSGKKPDTTAGGTVTDTSTTAALTELSTGIATEESGKEEGMLSGKWCDVEGSTELEFDGTKMYVLWWKDQDEKDVYNIKYEKTDYGTTYIKNANENEYSFGIMSALEYREDGSLCAYEEILDGEGHSYRFVPEEQVEEARAVKDFSKDSPKTIESKEIKSFSLYLKHYMPDGMDSANYSWEVKRLDDGKYTSDFTGMGSSYVVIQDKQEVDGTFAEGIQEIIDRQKLAENNGLFFSHDKNDVEYSLDVTYTSGERLSIKAGSKALDKWCVDDKEFVDYARSIIK